jgi:hypothetical protein
VGGSIGDLAGDVHSAFDGFWTTVIRSRLLFNFFIRAILDVGVLIGLGGTASCGLICRLAIIACDEGGQRFWAALASAVLRPIDNCNSFALSLVGFGFSSISSVEEELASPEW